MDAAPILRLVAAVAHDLNNCLVPIIGYSEMLLEEAPQEAPQRPLLQDMRDCALRASEVAQGFESLTRSPLLQTMQMDIADLLSRLGVSREAPAGRVRIDPYLAEQVLGELGRHDAAGAGLVSVEVDRQSDTLEIRWRFNPHGTGAHRSEVRLADALNLVRQTGGRLLVEGDTAVLQLPYSRPSPRLPVEGRGRVWIVDSDEAVRRSVGMVLERAGYHVVGHAELPAEDSPDILIIESRPCRVVNCPVLFISPTLYRESVSDLLANPTRFHFLQKPFTPHQLLAALQRFMV